MRPPRSIRHAYRPSRHAYISTQRLEGWVQGEKQGGALPAPCAGHASAWETIPRDKLPQHNVPVKEVPVSCDTTMDELHSLFRCS